MATNEYRGKNRDGVHKEGRFQGEPADLIEPAFNAGWLELTVFDAAGVEVGGIGVDETGSRTWWSGF